MKTQYYTATSLDGFIADPNDSLEWLFALGDPEETTYPTFFRDVGALVMGSSTYEWLLRNVIKLDSPEPQPWPYELPVWVFTTRNLRVVPNADIRFVRGDVRPVHADMMRAAEGKNVWLVGGGDLVGQFYDAGLLNEIFVQVASVTLGAGKPLLPRVISNPPLQLVSSTKLGPNMIELHYIVPPKASNSID